MATNIPPHNLSETIDACLLLIREPGASIDQLDGDFYPDRTFPQLPLSTGIVVLDRPMSLGEAGSIYAPESKLRRRETVSVQVL